MPFPIEDVTPHPSTLTELLDYERHQGKLVLSYLSSLTRRDPEIARAATEYLRMHTQQERREYVEPSSLSLDRLLPLRHAILQDSRNLTSQLRTRSAGIDIDVVQIAMVHLNSWDSELAIPRKAVGNFPVIVEMYSNSVRGQISGKRTPSWSVVEELLSMSAQLHTAWRVLDMVPDVRSLIPRSQMDIQLQNYILRRHFLRGSWYATLGDEYAREMAHVVDDKLLISHGFTVLDLMKLRDWYLPHVVKRFYSAAIKHSLLQSLFDIPVTDVADCWVFMPVDASAETGLELSRVDAMMQFLSLPARKWYWASPKLSPFIRCGEGFAGTGAGWLYSDLVPLVDHLGGVSVGENYYRSRASMLDRSVGRSLQRLIPEATVETNTHLPPSKDGRTLECDVLCTWGDLTLVIEGKGVSLARKVGTASYGAVRAHLKNTVSKAVRQILEREDNLFEGDPKKQILGVYVPFDDMGGLSLRIREMIADGYVQKGASHISILPYELWHAFPLVFHYPDMFLGYLAYRQYVSSRPWVWFMDEWEVMGAFLNAKSVPRLNPSPRGSLNVTVMAQNYQEDFNALYRQVSQNGSARVLPHYLKPNLSPVVERFLATLRRVRPAGWLNCATAIWCSSQELREEFSAGVSRLALARRQMVVKQVGEEFLAIVSPGYSLDSALRSTKFRKSMLGSRLGWVARTTPLGLKLEWAWYGGGYPEATHASGALVAPLWTTQSEAALHARK